MAKCGLLPNYSTKKDGTCIRYEICSNQFVVKRTKHLIIYLHRRILDPRCKAKGPYLGKPRILPGVTKGGEKSMDPELREKLKQVKLDENQVISLLKEGLTVWEVTEKVYGVEFDHSDRDTWIFYSKVNRIRKKYGLPLNKPKVEQSK